MAPHAITPPSSNGMNTPEPVSPSGSQAEQEQDQALGPTLQNRTLSVLPSADQDEFLDLVCVGFGPASLAIAVALHDRAESQPQLTPPKVAFLEKQPSFAWHSGMQLPGATMQISWIKDLATLRNPRSHFTFLNYLHESGRLVRFSNLGTFLPQRVEYEAYMKWAAAQFSHLASYSQEGFEVLPLSASRSGAPANGASNSAPGWLIRSRNVKTGKVEERRARHVVLSLGGRPRLPNFLPQSHPRVIHSSQYMYKIPSLLSDNSRPYTILVIGSGQSSAEIFHDLYSRFPEAKVRLLIRGSALKPSDDSPFVNETFNPEHVDDVFETETSLRQAGLLNEKATNYGVVRLELLERIYADMYEESVRHPERRDEDLRARILPYRDVTGVQTAGRDGKIRVHVNNMEARYRRTEQQKTVTDEIDADTLIVAAGYERNAHEEMLKGMQSLSVSSGKDSPKWRVNRDYSVAMKEGSASKDAGIWLQGCNEGTHGLSDTLLSILSVRGGEIVDSIFGRH